LTAEHLFGNMELMDGLTERQQEILAAIRGYVARRGYPPSIRELSGAFGMAASSMLDHVRALERKGWIRRRSGRSRSIELLHVSRDRSAGVEVPILGRVAAGTPILAEENRDGSIVVDPRYARGEKLFALRVKGDSMVDAGLYENDVCIIRMTETAENGDIVVAYLDGEATVKRYRRRGETVELLPENPAYEPIVLSGTEDFRILGKVVSLYRQI